MTVSQKLFLKNKDGKILALRRSDTDPHRPLTWDLPGGIVDHGEVLIENIIRETVEETGIIPQDIAILDALSGFNKDGTQAIQIAYTATAPHDTVTLSYEHDEYRWVSKEEFVQLESTKAFLVFVQKI